MPAKLRPVPETPPRALGMIRVSKERDGMMSPDVQRSAILDYCRARGYDVVEWVEGIDQSGSRAKSAWWPTLTEAVGRVQSGDVDVIVVWKFSRTARHRLKWAIALDGVEAAGGRLESATEQIDTSTSMGDFSRGMMAELSIFEARRMGEVWKEVHAKRLAEGRSPSGLPKYGYVWNKAEQVHEPDPETAPILAQAYRRYISGESFHAIAQWLNGSGHWTRAGGRWSDSSVLRVLDTGFAAGFIPWQGRRHPGNHEKLITDDEWQAYQDARAERRAAPARRERSQYVLSGLVTCARCGTTMVASPGRPVGKASFRCQLNKLEGPTACVAGSVSMDYVVDAVLDWVREVVADDVDRAAVAAERSLAARTSVEGEMVRLTREISKVDDQLRDLTLQLVEKVVPRDAYEAARDALTGRQARLDAELQELGRRSRAASMDPAATAQGLLDDWLGLAVAQRRTILARLTAGILVHTGDRSGRKGEQFGASNARVRIVQSWPMT